MLEIRYNGKETEINLELLMFMEKERSGGRKGREEEIESRVRQFYIKAEREAGENGAGKKLKEEIEVCYLILGKEAEKARNERHMRQITELKKMLLETAGAVEHQRGQAA